MENRVESGMLERLFGVSKPIIGMIHVRPLPGSPRGRNADLEAAYVHAVDEAKRLEDGGIDGLLLENAGDIPFLKPEEIGFETVAAMTVIGDRIRRATKLPFGFNIVANAARASIACARMSGGSFVRVNQWANAYVANEGLVEGAAAQALRYRSLIDGNGIAVMADVHVKHGSHAIVADREVAEQARDVEFFDADILIATGSRTGHATAPGELDAVRAGSDLPVLVGSGLNAENAADLMRIADGAIVGVSFKDSGKMSGSVNVPKVRALMDVMAAIRKG
ncbi:MAG: BtpA/SgcQ family protein [Bauldia sp.]|uniref:BtpA/SgcQ family protein n=1 Tax=Bauldia sp. TaxID=2575872 RepID=UPI001D5E643B|nr:BtpA/SgcQ family protein [Bauldia sp.]MCB1495633.1 BtpA/SgcQ family protein [Bauldia sp.]